MERKEYEVRSHADASRSAIPSEERELDEAKARVRDAQDALNPAKYATFLLACVCVEQQQCKANSSSAVAPFCTCCGLQCLNAPSLIVFCSSLDFNVETIYCDVS